MSILPKEAHSMRIIALPLTRAKVSRDAKISPFPKFNSNTMPVFYHFDLISPFGGREDLSWHKKVLGSVMNKATDLWTGLGKAPKGSWKLWTYELGERIADRIDFEELALRNVDPSLGPTVPRLTGATRQVNDVRESRSRLHSLAKIPLIYPPSLYPTCPTVGEDHTSDPSLAHLRTLLAIHGPRHRRGFYLWTLIAPLTAPIALIPLIPNFPLFFCVWRSWSHYRAYRSSQYLSSLLDQGLIEPDPSLELDKLYGSFAPSPSISPTPPSSTLATRSSEKTPTTGDVTADRKSEAAPGMGASQSECILLTREAMPHILKILRLPEPIIVNMHRAMDQAHGRLGSSSSSDLSWRCRVKNK